MNLGGPSACRFRVRKEPDGSLVIAHSRYGALGKSVFTVFVFCGWYWMILLKPTSIEDAWLAVRRFADGDWYMWILAVVPIVTLPGLAADMKTVIAGRFFRFDAILRTISRNHRSVARFDDVSSIQIRTLHKSEEADEYMLSLLLGDQGKVRIALNTDRQLIVSAADELADLLDVEIVMSDKKIKVTDSVTEIFK